MTDAELQHRVFIAAIEACRHQVRKIPMSRLEVINLGAVIGAKAEVETPSGAM